MIITRLTNTLSGIFGVRNKDEVKRHNEASADRDAQGNTGYEKRDYKPGSLTPEQEEDAVKKLNSLPAFSEKGLVAELIKEDGRSVHVEIKDRAGNVVRRVPYEQLVQMFFDRNRTDKNTGRILNRAA